VQVLVDVKDCEAGIVFRGEMPSVVVWSKDLSVALQLWICLDPD
jgi:hypothetical protein